MTKRRKYLLMADECKTAEDEKKKSGKIRAVGYVRVSTKQQAADDRMGIEAQEYAIRTYAEENGYEIIRFFTDKVSGTEEHREALDELLFTPALDVSDVKAVISFKSDRIARDIKLYFYYMFVLEKRGIKLISVQENFDNVEFGLSSVFRSLTLFVAEQERKNIKIRTAGGRKIKAEAGGYAGGKPPYGYYVFNKGLVINEKEAQVVRIMFRLRDEENCILQEIVDILNEKGYKQRNGKPFVVATVSKILSNRRVYEGYYRYGDMKEYTKGQHEPILKKRVSSIRDIDELFQRIEAEEQQRDAQNYTLSDLNIDEPEQEDYAGDQDSNMVIEPTNDDYPRPIGIDIDLDDLQDDDGEMQEILQNDGEMQEILQVEQPVPAKPVVSGVFGVH